MTIRIKAPGGKKLKHLRTNRIYSEVVCDEKYRNDYVVVDSDENAIIEEKDGVTLSDRVSTLESRADDVDDALIELAGIIGGE